MYDRIKIWCDVGVVGDVMPTIANYLDNAKDSIDRQTGEIMSYGEIGNVKVNIHVGGVSIYGSIAKYLFDGSNVPTLDRHTTAQAMEKLSDRLHFHVGNGKVTSLEFATNFPMRYSVPMYLDRLGDMPRLVRNQFASSLYYQGKTNLKRLIFYDKQADAKAKGMIVPDVLSDSNILRYELKLVGQISRQLNVDEVTANSLSTKSIYMKLMAMYKDSYHSINKVKQLRTDIMTEIKTPTDALNVFVARLIREKGIDEVSRFIEELKAANVFGDAKNYTRFKNKIRDIASKADITQTDELIKELDNEISNVGIYS